MKQDLKGAKVLIEHARDSVAAAAKMVHNGDEPYRKMFGFTLGYDSNLGFIHEVHSVAGVDATGAQPPFNSSGPAGPSDLDLTLPLGGGGALGINVLEHWKPAVNAAAVDATACAAEAASRIERSASMSTIWWWSRSAAASAVNPARSSHAGV